jgi:hypothetical protein
MQFKKLAFSLGTLFSDVLSARWGNFKTASGVSVQRSQQEVDLWNILPGKYHP